MPICPNCRTTIPPNDVNVQKDVAYCRTCDLAIQLSDLIERDKPRQMVDPSKPPKGAWFVDDGAELRVGATTRSYGAFFLVPFMCVWSGLSLGGIYGTQIVSGQFNLFFSLFGIPFLLGSIFFWSFALMAINGKVEISLRGDDGMIFTGLGNIGFRRRFRGAEIARVYEDAARWRGTGSYGSAIVLEGRTRLKLGEGLSEPRRHFVLEMLRVLLLAGKPRN